MTVKITVKNDKGEVLGSFQGQEYKGIAQMAIENGIDIPTSCGIGSCYICACKIEKGAEYIQIDKVQPPIIDLDRDEKGEIKEVLSCVGGIKTDILKSKEEYEIVLQKQI